MSLKIIIIISILVVIGFLIACYNRSIDIDKVLRSDRKTSSPQEIVIQNLEQRFTYGSNGENVIIGSNTLKIYSSCVPPVVLHLEVSDDTNQIIAGDIAGNKFSLGNIKGQEIKDKLVYYHVGFTPTDKVIFKSSYSCFPYYYGFYILSPGKISRYYHYYSLEIRKESGESLTLDWKFSTYKGDDGKLVPDLFGDNKEGLVGVTIRQK